MTRIVQPTSGAIRAANRASVVDVLRRTGAATRAELTARTGLSRATVSSLVGDLLARGLVSERRASPAFGGGRPAAAVALNRSAGLAIAVDIGVQHVAVAVGDLARQVLAERWLPLPHGHSSRQGVATVLGCVEEAMAEADAEPEQVVGAAISIAAPVAPDSGRSLVPGVLPGWNGAALAASVAERWGVPVVVENDANLGALAESTWGRFAGARNLLYVKVANRVGLGVVIDGRLYHGSDGCAGEFGHLTARVDGARCWCGRRGCLEMYVGADGIAAQLGAAAAGIADPDTLVARARAGDPELLSVIAVAGQVLARGLASLALLFNPTAIVVGGELSALGDLLLEPVRAELSGVPFGTPMTVVHSSLGDRASMVGALALVLSETARFTDRSTTHPTRVDARPLEGAC